MRTTLSALVFLLMVSLGAPSWSQVPNLAVVFHGGRYPQKPQYDECRGWLVPDTLDVVAYHFNMYLSTVEFGIERPTIYALYMGDVHIPGALWMGRSFVEGVWITYPRPLNAFEPVVVMRSAILWVCNGCNHSVMDIIRVVPNQSSDLLRAIEWHTLRVVEGYGAWSYICGYVGTEQTTWGKVKALYR